MSLPVDNCCFCENLVRGLPEAPWDRVLYDSGRFVITPTKGALVPGWLLVVAKWHALCAGAISRVELDELINCLRTAKNMVRENFGEPTVFEHGPYQPGSSLGCGIDHLHLHVVPLSFSLRSATASLFPEVKWHPLSDLYCASLLFEAKIGYGLVQEPNDRMSWCYPPLGVRQLFRRVIAAELGVPEEFDYREFPNLSNVSLTLENLSQRLL